MTEIQDSRYFGRKFQIPNIPLFRISPKSIIFKVTSGYDDCTPTPPFNVFFGGSPQVFTQNTGIFGRYSPVNVNGMRSMPSGMSTRQVQTSYQGDLKIEIITESSNGRRTRKKVITNMKTGDVRIISG